MTTFALGPNRRLNTVADAGRRDAPDAGRPAAAPTKGATPSDAPPPAATARTEETVIGRSLSIVGDVVSDGPLRIEGSLKGDVSCASLIVAETGAIEGAVRAGKVRIQGTVKGQIMGDTVELAETATVAADIRHQGVGIALGARFDGALIWVDERTALGLGAADAGPGAGPGPGAVGFGAKS